MANPTVDCIFNLFKEGRKYTGHHRKYILENALSVCESPETREKIKLREAYGYFGHGRRILAGKLSLSEVETVKMPNGQQVIVENVPACLTTKFDVTGDGSVRHTQELLTENAPGKVVMGLHKSRVGGFSWACGGRDGGASAHTSLKDFHGFDYVLQPGFAENRGYILESVDGDVRGIILENIHKQGVSEPAAEKYLESWIMQESLVIPKMEEQIENLSVLESALREENADLVNRLKELESAEERRRNIVLEGNKRSVVVIPGKVLESIVSLADESDFHRITAFFEQARQVNFDDLPGGRRSDVAANAHPYSAGVRQEYGGAYNAPFGE